MVLTHLLKEKDFQFGLHRCIHILYTRDTPKTTKKRCFVKRTEIYQKNGKSKKRMLIPMPDNVKFKTIKHYKLLSWKGAF